MRGGKSGAFVVFAVHESSSDPIMTEAALPLSPTANLRLHAFNTHHEHTHTHRHACTQTQTHVVASAIFVRTFLFVFFFFFARQKNTKVTAFLSGSTKKTHFNKITIHRYTDYKPD